VPRDALSDRDLAGLLDEQIEAMQAMRAALEAERAALAARDGEALLTAVSRKSGIVAEVDRLESQRREVLARSGAATVRTGRAFSADAGLSRRWHQVLALTQQCRALNEANGQMIRAQRRRVDGVLSVLRGQGPAPAEYGRRGEQRLSSARRSLGAY
jgi:flagella synthesis protein FlgN